MSEKLIFEMFDRIKTLEEQVADLKSEIDWLKKGNTDNHTNADSADSDKARNKTKYYFDNNLYSKNRLVLAVVKKYVSRQKNINEEMLYNAFPKYLQGPFGVVCSMDYAKEKWQGYERRFFAKPDEIIHISGRDYVVCSQWYSGKIKSNMNRFLERARKLGFEIEETV